MSDSTPKSLVDAVIEALELAPQERAAFIAGLRAREPELAAEVSRLVARHEVDAGERLNPREEPEGSLMPGAQATVRVRPEGAAAAVTERPGTMLGNYKLLQKIGEGGFGMVFVAEQQSPVRRTVALKIIKLGMDTHQVIARFEAERQALAIMDHANIARVFDAGATQTGRPYFVMELVTGAPITTYCDKNNLSVPDRLELFEQVCNAVQHAHQKGIIHRDIKPSNILVGTQDLRPLVKVIDFGIAKATGGRLTEMTVFTEQRALIGTPEYMSPEQAEGSLDIDTRTDVYSLGVLLFELLTGSTPFESSKLRGAAYAEIERIIRETEPPKPSTRLSEASDTLAGVAAHRRTEPKKLGSLVRGELDWIVMKALEKDPSRRYDTAAGLGADVRRYSSGEGVAAAPPSRAYRLRKFARRNRAGVLTASMVSAALVAGLGAALWQAGVAKAAETRAEAQAKKATEAKDKAEASEKETAAIAAFQESQLSGIDLDAMGRLIREDLLADAKAEIERATGAGRVTPEQAAAERAQFESFLFRVNLTNIARRTMDRSIFERALKTIDERFEDQPLTKARLLQTTANTLKELGLFERASAPLAEAIELLIARWGAESVPVLIARRHSGGLLNLQGRLPEAEVELRAAMEGLRLILGEDNYESLAAAISLAGVLGNQSKMGEAQTLIKETLDRCERVLGSDDPLTLVCVNTLARQNRTLGELEEAESGYRRAAEGFRRVFGSDYSETMTTLSNLGAVLRARGKLAEAEPLLREVLERRRRVLGDDHPDTLVSKSNMGPLLRARGKPADAERYLRESIAGCVRVLGEEHLTTLRARENLAELEASRQGFAKAEELLRTVLTIRRRVQGNDDFDTLATLRSLASVVLSLDKLDEAEALNREAVDGYTRLGGPDHIETLRSVRDLASVLRVKGKPGEAEPLYRVALDGWTRTLGPNHLDTLSALQSMGKVMTDLNRLPEAEGYYRRALEGRRRGNGNDDTNTLIAISNLSLSLEKQGKLDEAEKLGQEALDRFRAVRGRDHRDTLSCAYNLGVIRLKQGDAARAEVLFRESVTGLAPKVAKDDTTLGRSRMSLGQALFDLRRFAEAEAELVEAERVFGLARPSKAPRDEYPNCLRKLVALYEAWDKDEPGKGMDAKAAMWRDRLSEPPKSEPAPVPSPGDH